MGCLKLTYREELPHLKVVHNNLNISSNSSAGYYRYGFNGREKDDEIKGANNSIVYEKRILDPRLGRWLSVDGESKFYTSQSPYSFTGNNPIRNKEINGDFWDVIADVVFVIADVAEIAYDYATTGEVSAVSVAALSADVVATFVPFVTGAGVAVRAGKAGAKAVEHGGAKIVKETAQKVEKKVVKSSDETVDVYRTYGDDAKADGFSWTPEDPSKVDNFRDKAGLPSGGSSGSNNSGQFMIEGKVKKSNIIKERDALPLDGNKGGLKEYIIDPKNVEKTKVSGVNPEL